MESIHRYNPVIKNLGIAVIKISLMVFNNCIISNYDKMRLKLVAKDGRQASSFSLSLTLITVKICWVLNNFFLQR